MDQFEFPLLASLPSESCLSLPQTAPSSFFKPSKLKRKCVKLIRRARSLFKTGRTKEEKWILKPEILPDHVDRLHHDLEAHFFNPIDLEVDVRHDPAHVNYFTSGFEEVIVDGQSKPVRSHKPVHRTDQPSEWTKQWRMPAFVNVVRETEETDEMEMADVSITVFFFWYLELKER